MNVAESFLSSSPSSSHYRCSAVHLILRDGKKHACHLNEAQRKQGSFRHFRCCRRRDKVGGLFNPKPFHRSAYHRHVVIVRHHQTRSLKKAAGETIMTAFHWRRILLLAKKKKLIECEIMSGADRANGMHSKEQLTNGPFIFHWQIIDWINTVVNTWLSLMRFRNRNRHLHRTAYVPRCQFPSRNQWNRQSLSPRRLFKTI